jgi:hypothetical protein
MMEVPQVHQAKTGIRVMAVMAVMAGTDCNGYKGWTVFIITLVVVNLNSLSLTQIVN